MSLLDLEGRYVTVTPGFGRMLGRRPEDLIGMHFLDITHPEDRDRGESMYRRLLVGEASASVRDKKRYAHSDGRWLHVQVNITLIRGANGEPKQFFTHVSDISERSNAELARSRLASIVESSRDAIFATSLEGMIMAWNPAAEALFGYSAEEAIGRNSAEIARPLA